MVSLTRGVIFVGSEPMLALLRRELPQIDVHEGASAHVPRLTMTLDGSLTAEEYTLHVAGDQIAIRAGDDSGLFYAVVTLKQLLPAAVWRGTASADESWSVPECSIADRPRFRWRGAMLDTSRHFMPVHFIKRFVDLLAMHKMNVLHLHLTDDQGWRFESKKYPLLTGPGASRDETRWDWEEEGDATPHGGSYSQEDLSELVAYAAQRCVTVVPEIELPGHSMAAIAAYPELGNSPSRQVKVPGHIGVFTEVLNPEQSTIEFFQDVFSELLDIFPSTYIHVGGDECPKDEWRASSRAQELMAERGLRDEEELQSWFIRQMDGWLEERGRRLVGWDEILEGGLAPGATVMSWRGEAGGIEAARAGHDVIMCPGEPTYFDHYQSPRMDEPLAIGGLNQLHDVYSYEPIPAELSSEAASHVLGTQFQVWTSFMPDGRDVEYMSFPRACALAEVAWSPRETRDFAGFSRRLDEHLLRLEAKQVNYRPLDGPLPFQMGGTGRFRRPE